MQREEKALDAALEALVAKTNDLKATLLSMLMKLDHEHETINWPTLLDNYALLSGHISTMSRILKNEKTPNLRNLITLPIKLSPNRDEELAKLTEKRITVFSHEVVPDYLRTKPDPDVEQREQQVIQRANQFLPDVAQKQINTVNKMVNVTLDLISNAREQWESEAGSRTGSAQTSSVTDTHLIISAVCLGKGLKAPMKISTTGTGAPQMPGAAQVAPPSSVAPGIGKAPSAIKTNIKSAASVHPYAR